MSERLSLGDFLEQGKIPSPDPLRVTIVPVDDDERVKVTPVLSGRECGCSASLLLDPAEIVSVTSTDQTHTCCGRVLPVVEPEFQSPTLSDVFRQLVARVERGDPASAIPHPPRMRQRLDDSEFPVGVRAADTAGRRHCWWDSPECVDNTLWVTCIHWVDGLPVYSKTPVGSCESPHLDTSGWETHERFGGTFFGGGITLGGMPCSPGFDRGCVPIVVARAGWRS